MTKYENTLKWILKGKRPAYALGGMVALFVFTMILNGILKPKSVFFPDNEPNTINTFIKMPIGTQIEVTDSVSRIAENRIMSVLGEKNPIVESVVTMLHSLPQITILIIPASHPIWLKSQLIL